MRKKFFIFSTLIIIVPFVGKKYIKNKRAEDVFTEKDKKACVDKISAEEMPNIKKGMYKVEI